MSSQLGGAVGATCNQSGGGAKVTEIEIGRCRLVLALEVAEWRAVVGCWTRVGGCVQWYYGCGLVFGPVGRWVRPRHRPSVFGQAGGASGDAGGGWRDAACARVGMLEVWVLYRSDRG